MRESGWCSVYAYIPLLYTLLLESQASGVAGGRVITFCNPTRYEVEAGVQGSIISPNTVSQSQPITCKLKLTGLPEHSWFGLYVEQMNLACTYKYNCRSSWWFPMCDSYLSYITLEEAPETMCSPENNPLYRYTDSSNSVTINLYSDYYSNHVDYFRLTYKVASVVDVGALRPVHAVDTKDKSSGYVVSHSGYGKDNYRPEINSKLIVNNISSNTIEISFNELSLRTDFLGNCVDYINVIIKEITVAKVCGDRESQERYENKWVQFTTEENQITFQFITTDWWPSGGFIFQYTVAPTPTTLTTPSETPHGTSTSHYTETAESTTTYEGSTSTQRFSTMTGTSIWYESTVASLTWGTMNTREKVKPPVTVSSNSQADIFESKKDSQNQTNPPQGGNSLYIGVGVGIGVLVVLIIIVLTVVMMRKRKIKTDTKSEIANGNGFSNSRTSQAVNNAYELPEMGNSDYSIAGEPVKRESSVTQTPTSHRASRSNVYSTVSGTGRKFEQTESQSGNQEYCLADENDDTYYSSPDRDEPVQASKDDANGDQDTTYSLADEVTRDPANNGLAPYHLADSAQLNALSGKTTGDTVYQLAEEEDEYVNTAAVIRHEAEVNLDDEYSPIVASTKSGKEVTELIDNELYGT